MTHSDKKTHTPPLFLKPKQALTPLFAGLLLGQTILTAHAFASEAPPTAPNQALDNARDTVKRITQTVLPEIIVSADFKNTNLHLAPISVTALSEEALSARAAENLEDIINLAVNVNFSSGSSRARFFQIRGIGDRSEFSQPVNASVGLLVDGVDFTGMGGATLFDVRQVEVLRGPQGIRYGANALAGLINVFTNDPTPDIEGKITATVGDYGTRSLGFAVGGPVLNDTLSARVALHKHQSDGYINNTFLGTDDTNERDETTARLKLLWQPAEDHSLRLSVNHIDIDNGYDAFSLDNNRSTRSDEPGRDTQETTAIALQHSWEGDKVQTTTAISMANSSLLYSYDEDWTFDGFHADGYSSTDAYQRERDTYSAELRIASQKNARIFNNSSDWLVGVYLLSRDTDLKRDYTYAGPFDSRYNSDAKALFGKLDTDISDKLSISTGLRVEQLEIDYDDSNLLGINQDDTQWGGKLSLQYTINDDMFSYASVSRGYRAGGVNIDGSLPADKRPFDSESLWNIETGLNAQLLDGQLDFRVTAFYALRRDQQVRSSLIRCDDGSEPTAMTPCTGRTEFIDYSDNAARGKNYGLESEWRWQANEYLHLFGGLGLLVATFDEYAAPATQADPNGLDLSGEEQAQAPSYQFVLGGQYEWLQNWFVRLELEGKDSFYLSDRHRSKTESYVLANAQLGYRSDQWTLAAWGRNLTDQDTITRGFGSFGNDPRNGYQVGQYFQLGEPRIVGVSATYNF